MSAGTSPATTTFIRPDGREKVTGVGRYTADLATTGMAHARFRYADHPHARVLRIDTTRARALPGVVAVVTQEDLPEVRFGGLVQDRTLFAKDVVRFEGEIVAGVAALTEAIAAEAARLIEVEYEPLPVITDFVAAMEPDAPLVHAAWASYERDENMVSNGNTLGYHTIVKGDADAATGAGRRRRQEQVRVRSLAGRADRAARRARRVAGRRGHDLVLDAGSLCRPRRCRADPADPRGQRPGRRPAPGRGVRGQVRSPFRGAGRRARTRRAPPGEVGLLPRGGVQGDRAASRGDRDGVRDRRDARRAPGGAQGAARPGQGRVLRRGRVLGADGRDARVRPVPDRQRLRRVVPQLHEPTAFGLGPGSHRPPGLLGPGAAHGRGGGGARHRPGGAPQADADREGRRGSHPSDLRRDRRQTDARARRRDDRLRTRAPGGRGDRRGGRLVALLAWRLPAPTSI